MGFDKPDIEFVVHLQSPPSIIEYYQQAGRAGRGIPRARAVLMRGREDGAIHDFFLDAAFITEREAEEVLQSLSTSEWRRMREIEQEVNMSSERLDKALKLLDVEGAVIRAWPVDAITIELDVRSRETEEGDRATPPRTRRSSTVCG